MFPTRLKLQLFALKAKYGVDLLRQESDYVTIHIRSWHTYKHEFLHLLDALRSERAINDIAIENDCGTITIFFEREAIHVPLVEKWVKKLGEFGL